MEVQKYCAMFEISRFIGNKLRSNKKDAEIALVGKECTVYEFRSNQNRRTETFL